MAASMRVKILPHTRHSNFCNKQAPEAERIRKIIYKKAGCSKDCKKNFDPCNNFFTIPAIT